MICGVGCVSICTLVRARQARAGGLQDTQDGDDALAHRDEAHVPQISEPRERIRENARLERGGALVAAQRVDADRAHGAREAGIGDAPP